MNSPKNLRLLNMLKIPKRLFINIPKYYLEVGWIYKCTPQIYSELCSLTTLSMDGHQRTISQLTDHYVRPWFGTDMVLVLSFSHVYVLTHDTHHLVFDSPMRHLLPPLFGVVMVVLASRKGSFINNPWMILREFYTDFSKPNVFI